MSNYPFKDISDPAVLREMVQDGVPCEACEGEGYVVVLLGPHEVMGGGTAAGPVEQDCSICSGTGKTR